MWENCGCLAKRRLIRSKTKLKLENKRAMLRRLCVSCKKALHTKQHLANNYDTTLKTRAIRHH